MKKNLYIILICILLLSSFTPILGIENLYDKKRFAQIIFISVIFMLFFSSIKLSTQVKLLFFSIFIIGFISVLLSSNLLYSTLQLTHTFFLVHLILFGVYIQKRVNSLFYLLFFSNLFLICVAILNYSFFLLNRSTPIILDILYAFNNIRFFNQFQVICLPIFLYFLAHSKLSRVATILLTLNLFFFLASGARGAILSCLIMIVFAAFFKLISQKALVTLIKCVLFAVVFFILYTRYHGSEELIAYTFRTSSSGRIEIWFDLISKLNWFNVFIGNGPGLYFIDRPMMRYSHPHNSVLQLVYNWGGIVTLIILLMLYKVVKQCIFHFKNFPYNPAFNTCLLVIIGLVLYSFFSGVIVMPLPQTFILIFIGILIGFITPQPKLTKRTSMQLVFILLIIIFYLSISLLSYSCVSSQMFGPNFWSNGLLSFAECKMF